MQDMKSIETAAHAAVMRGVSSALSELGGKASPSIPAAPVARRGKATASAAKVVSEKKENAVKTAKPKGEKTPKAAKPAGAPRAKGEKRSPADLAALVTGLGAYIKANPGNGIETIAKGLNATTKELSLPIKKLVDDKTITKKGQKRATRYFPR